MNALSAVPAVQAPRHWTAENLPPSAETLLKTAATALRALAAVNEERVHPISDSLANDTAENFQELQAKIEECFEALCKIEDRTRWTLACEAAYHRNALESIEALGVPLELEEVE